MNLQSRNKKKMLLQRDGTIMKFCSKNCQTLQHCENKKRTNKTYSLNKVTHRGITYNRFSAKTAIFAYLTSILAKNLGKYTLD